MHAGADGQVDLAEKDANLDIAKRVGRLLTDAGFFVFYARETDTLLTTFSGTNDRENRRAEIQARLDLANNGRADVYISIHNNGYRDKAAAGTETYYCADRPFAEQSKRLAQLALDNILAQLGAAGYRSIDRGAKDDLGASYPGYHYFALGPALSAHPSEMPAIIVESLFVTNDVEAALLRTDAVRQAIATGYARAITAYFQTMPTPTASPRPATATPTATPTATRRPATATPTPTAGVPPEMVRGSDAKQQVALTFDAGASSEPTTAILDALKSAGVHSTMFLTGAWIKDNPALVRRILADGHQVANHTMTHPDLVTLADAEIQQQLADTARLYQETTGAQIAPYFRPPFGSRDKRVLQVAWRAGYRAVYWTLDSGDWVADATPAGVRDKVLQGTKNGYIVIMHLGSPQTAQVLPDVLKGLLGAGFRLVFVSQME